MQIKTTNKQGKFPERFIGHAKCAVIKCKTKSGKPQKVEIASTGRTVMGFMLPCNGEPFELCVGFDIDTDDLTITTQEDCVLDVTIEADDDKNPHA